jgi:hypothetical protein
MLRSSSRWVLRNHGMMISKENPKKLEKKIPMISFVDYFTMQSVARLEH